MWCLVVSSARSATQLEILGDSSSVFQGTKRQNQLPEGFSVTQKSCITLELLRESRPSQPFETGPRRVDRRLTCSDWLPGCLESVNWDDKKTRWGSGSSGVEANLGHLCRGGSMQSCSIAFQSGFNQVEIKRPPQKVDRSFKQSLQEQSGASQNFDERVEYDQDWYGGGNCRQVRKIYWQRLVVQKRWRMRFWHLEQG